MRRAVAALVLMAFVAVGCSATRPYAAVVNGERIEEDDVYNEMELASLQQGAPGQTVQGVVPDASYDSGAVSVALTDLIYSSLLVELAARLDVEVTQQDIAQAQASLASPQAQQLVSRLDEDFRKDLEERIALRAAVTQKLLATSVDEEALGVAFESNRDSFICASVIVVADLATAQNAESRIRAGEEFERVFDSVVDDPQIRQIDGRVCLRRDAWQDLGSELVNQLETLAVGELSAAVDTPVGGFVVRIEEIRFEDVRDQLIGQQGIDPATLVQEAVTEASLRADVDVNPRFGVWTLAPTGGTVEAPFAPAETGESQNDELGVPGLELPPGVTGEDGQIVVPGGPEPAPAQ